MATLNYRNFQAWGTLWTSSCLGLPFQLWQTSPAVFPKSWLRFGNGNATKFKNLLLTARVAASAGLHQPCIPTELHPWDKFALCDHAHYTDSRYTENTALLTAFANTLRNAEGFFFVSNGPWSQCVLQHTLYLNRMKITADRAIPRQHK